MTDQIEPTEPDTTPLQFYASIELKQFLPIVFFTLVSLALLFVALSNPSASSAFIFIVSTVFVLGGVWLEWRRGWPRAWHGPVCEFTPAGITFWPKHGRRQFLPWDDLESVGHDMSDNALIFHTKQPELYDRRYLLLLKRPPYVASGLTTPDGEYLLNLVDQYWDEETKTARYSS